MALSESTQVNDGLSTRKRKHEEVEDSHSHDDEDPRLYIIVRRVGKAENESLHLHLDSKASVLELKKKIADTLKEQEEADIPVERQRLIFSGKMLRDDTQSLEMDLNMKPSSDEDEHKHFVHLSPLPKGAAPSARTERELADVAPVLSPHEENMRRARRIGARQRRRRREGQEGRGLMDAAAYHPYALDLTSGFVAGPGHTISSLALTAAEEEALLSVAAAAEQSRFAQEVAIQSIHDAALTEALTQQYQQGLAAAVAPGAASLRVGSVADPLCPFGSHAEAAARLLGAHVPPTSAVSLLQYAQPHLHFPTTEASLMAAMLPSSSLEAQASANSAAAVSLLQDVLGMPGVATASTSLPDVLDQVALNAGELANTLRMLQTHRGTLATPSAAASLSSPAALEVPSTPQAAGAVPLSLQDQLASALGSPGVNPFSQGGGSQRFYF